MPVVLNGLVKLLTGNMNLAAQQNFTFRDLAITAVIGKLCPYCSFYGSRNSFESSVHRYIFYSFVHEKPCSGCMPLTRHTAFASAWLAVANFISVVDIV